MLVTAILAIRNEAAYLANCLRHLVENQIDFVIVDHGSSDSSAEICRRREFAGNLVDIQEMPFTGVFSLTEQLQRKMQIIDTLHADWIIHLDADEVMHSYRDGESLNQALGRLDAQGWNVVNFDEFVFLPIGHDYVPEATGHQPLPYYYFFEPFAPRLLRGWKRASGFSFRNGGHTLAGNGLRIAPEHFALRHYMVRSQAHALQKYTTRTFAPEDLANGWHHQRINKSAESFRLPAADVLRKLATAGARQLDRSDPWAVHYWNRSKSAVGGIPSGLSAVDATS